VIQQVLGSEWAGFCATMPIIGGPRFERATSASLAWALFFELATWRNRLPRRTTSAPAMFLAWSTFENQYSRACPACGTRPMQSCTACRPPPKARSLIRWSRNA